MILGLSSALEHKSPEQWAKTHREIGCGYIIDEATPRHTKFTIETMPWMIPSSPDEYLQLMEECFDKLKGKIISCHLKDVLLLNQYTFQLRECACGEGTINLEKFVELASRENRNMPMIIEHLNSDQEYLDSLAYVKKRMGKLCQ